MPHDTPLIATIVAGLGLAFLLGLAAQRLRLPPIAGYLLAGVAIGPFTPGFVADQKLAAQLAELGVILLMFGVGLHFSLKDLLSVRAIAIPGAIGQIAVAIALGSALAWLFGWPWGAGLVFGLALSVASTVVLLRALQERRLVETERGRIAVGWLIVEDLVMVVALVLIPPLSGWLGGRPAPTPPSVDLAALLDLGPVATTLALTAAKVTLFIALMLVVGRRLVPWLLHYVAHTGSRELFRLAVLATALGVAFGSVYVFGVSFALGAFFAGMVMAESPLSSQAAKETLPLRDAFAVLFFVSVGMLFNPAVLVTAPLAVLATVAIIVVGKSAAAYGIVRAFGHPKAVALTISASLAQIGEFSFILAVMGVGLGVLPEAARDLIVAGALISILVNPLLFRLLERHAAQTPAGAAAQPAGASGAAPAEPEERPTEKTGHGVVIGFGRVGSRLAAGEGGAGVVVVEDNEEALAAARAQGFEAFRGPVGDPGLLDRLNLGRARWLAVAIPDPHEAGAVIEQARAIAPSLRIVARAHSEAGVAHLVKAGADEVVMGEAQLAIGMAAALEKLGAKSPPVADTSPSQAHTSP